MATLAGIVSFQFSSLALQYRVFSVPWVTRSRAILCLKGREYNSSSSSSVPIRYIPKKSKKNQLTNDIDNKNRTTVLNNTSPLRIDLHKKHNNHSINKKLLFADAKQEKFKVEEIDRNLGVINECLMKEPEEVGSKEMRISQQKDICQLGIVRGSKAVEYVKKLAREKEEQEINHKARLVDGGLVKEPEDAVVKEISISQQKDIRKVGILQASKVVEVVKESVGEKEGEEINRDVRVADDELVKEPEKAVVKERRINQQKDIHKVGILQASKSAEDVKELAEENEEQEIDRDMLVVVDGHVKEPEEVVFKERRISQQKGIHKVGILQGSKASKDIKKLAEDKEEEQTDHSWWVIDNELIEEPEELSVEEIRINPQKNMQEVDILGCGKAMQDAEKAAIQLLAMRAYTAVELKKKLHAKRFPPEIVDALINGFQRRGLINDSLYAESFSRSRWSSSSWGPRRIKIALSKKGVTAADAEKAIKLVFEEGEFGEDKELRLGMSKLSMDHLFVQASKQWLRGQDVPKEKRKSRVIRWLEYRGFGWDVISFVMKKLESQYPP